MTHETKKTRVQFLNGLAVAAVSLSVSHYLSDHHWWSILVGVVAATALHCLALLTSRD